MDECNLLHNPLKINFYGTLVTMDQQSTKLKTVMESSGVAKGGPGRA